MPSKKNHIVSICALAIHFGMLILAIAVFPVAAFGQSNQGSIAGNVADESGAMIPNAKIIATEVATGTEYQTVSTSAGAYRLPNLKIGTYNVSVRLEGMQEQDWTAAAVEGVKLDTGQRLDGINLSLIKGGRFPFLALVSMRGWTSFL